MSLAEESQAPTQIKLAKEEQLELENVQLRMEASRRNMQDLLVQRGDLVKQISKKYDTDLEGWTIDLQQGTVTRPSAVVQVVPSDPEGGDAAS